MVIRNFISSPLVRISLGLVLLTTTILLATELLGLIPDTRSAELKSRKVIAESLAVQISTALARNDLHGIGELLRTLVGRNQSVLSAGVRGSSSELIAQFGQHEENWTLESEQSSTATQVQVSLFDDQDRWGSVELRFVPLPESGNPLSLSGSFIKVILITALGGFLAYLLFLKRSLRELNPDAVIPERVRTALDTLAEGLLIVDKKGFIVFSNQAFTLKVGMKAKDLIGNQCADFNWEFPDLDSTEYELPWITTLKSGQSQSGATIKLKTALSETYTFTVNTSPIAATSGNIRGALVTFDDITEIEAKNNELERMLDKLESSKREISRQNQELQVLATRDPLTGVLNRRSLFQGLDTLFADAREEDRLLSCLMVDIDHFKSVNDQFGHAVGDKVIKLLAMILTEYSRPNDLVGRYGGEEFCVIFPGADGGIGIEIAERMRIAVQESSGAKFTSALQITSSFGVSVLSEDIGTSGELIDRADKALYAAKEGGRNRVVLWTEGLEEEKPASSQEQKPELQSTHTEENRPEQDYAPISNQSGQKLGEETRLMDLEDRHLSSKCSISMSLEDIAIGSGLAVNGSKQGAENIPNGVLLFDRIEQATRRCLRYGTKIALLVLSLDSFQRVVDTLGSSVGEKSAKVALARIKQVLRSTDTATLADQEELLFTITRIERNEIVVLLTDIKQERIVTGILRRLISTFGEPAEIEGEDINLTVTMGVSIYPNDGVDPQSLLRNAGIAMRKAKEEQGRNRFKFYGDDIQSQARKQIKLEVELHRSIERDELIVFYQPKVDLHTGNILGMEALVRWQHPQLGLVPPNEFIPLAEQTGYIENIGRWVVEVACRQVLSWRDEGYKEINVAVNLSPVEFRNPQLAEQIIQQISDIGVSPGALELEITETVVIQSMETAVTTLDKLSNAGLSITLDDFGTGYSSLSYLKRFPLQKIKIDRSFISDFMSGSNDAAIVSAIIAMSHSLGLRVVAEGVETDEQLRFLQDLHCDEMQGYFVSRPVPRKEAGDLLARSSSIRRMILEYGINFAELMKFQGSSLATEMAGIISEFPKKDGGRKSDECA